MPELELKSDRMVLAAPLSYTGSAKRIWPMAHRGQSAPGRIGLAAMASVLVVIAWTLVTCWYVVSLLLLGVITIPYRIVRRGHRRDKRLQQQHREVLEAMRRDRGNAS